MERCFCRPMLSRIERRLNRILVGSKTTWILLVIYGASQATTVIPCFATILAAPTTPEGVLPSFAMQSGTITEWQRYAVIPPCNIVAPLVMTVGTTQKIYDDNVKWSGFANREGHVMLLKRQRIRRTKGVFLGGTKRQAWFSNAMGRVAVELSHGVAPRRPMFLLYLPRISPSSTQTDVLVNMQRMGVHHNVSHIHCRAFRSRIVPPASQSTEGGDLYSWSPIG
jgi:hypothetical protein